MLNRASLIGHLGADPEIRRTQDGRAIVNLRLATSESWRDKATGERREKTEWHRVVVFNEALAKVAEQYLKKGARVLIEGKIATRKWTDQANVERYATEIVVEAFGGTLQMLDRREREMGASSPDDYGSTTTRPTATRAAGNPPPGHTDMDDEIPF